MAYAPGRASPVDRANVVAASAPIRRRVPPVRRAMPAPPRPKSIPWSAKGAQGQDSVVATSTCLAAAQGNEYLDARGDAGAEREQCDVDDACLGDTDMTQMRSYFVKPQAAIADDLLG